MLEKYIGYAYLILAAIGSVYTYARSREKAPKAVERAVKSLRGVALTFAAVFGSVGPLDVRATGVHRAELPLVIAGGRVVCTGELDVQAVAAALPQT